MFLDRLLVLVEENDFSIDCCAIFGWNSKCQFTKLLPGFRILSKFYDQHAQPFFQRKHAFKTVFAQHNSEKHPRFKNENKKPRKLYDYTRHSP